MIDYKEALAILDACALNPLVEEVPLFHASGRILATPIMARRDVPALDLSAMDGYACKAEDRGQPLCVVETIAAGETPHQHIGKGQCSRIMTGALLPPGADCVVMFEDAHEKDGMVTVNQIREQKHIRYRAEDFKQGEQVLPAGILINPSVCAVLASQGQEPVPVYGRPVVGLIATGDELIEPGSQPSNAQIHNSNSYQCHAQVQGAGCTPRYFGIAQDTPEAIRALFTKALAHCQVVLLLGGVSKGDFDCVAPVLASCHVDILFKGIAVKPGKPTLFGRTTDNQFVFGLPGNPVAAFVIFELLVKPFLYRMMCHDFRHPRVVARLQETVSRKRADRLEFIPVVFADDHTVACIPYHGTAHISAYANAQGMMALPKNVARLDKGTEVEIIVL